MTGANQTACCLILRGPRNPPPPSGSSRPPSQLLGAMREGSQGSWLAEGFAFDTHGRGFPACGSDGRDGRGTGRVLCSGWKHVADTGLLNLQKSYLPKSV